MYVSKERVVRDGHLIAFEGEQMTDEEAVARNLTAAVEEPQLEDLTVAQLRELAEQEGVELPAKAKKADIIEAINGELEEGEPEEDLYEDEEGEECE